MSRYELALLRPDGEPELYPVRPDGSFIGRSQAMDIPVEGSTVSRRHVRLWEQDGAIHVEDLSSRNGIVVNGERVRSAKLKSGDQLAVGQNHFVLRDTTQPAPVAWPKPITPASQPTPSAMRTAFDLDANDASDMAAVPDESSWSRYLLDPDKLQRKIAAAAIELTAAGRAYVLAGGAGTSRFRVLAAHTASGNPDGPAISDILVDRVLRSKAPVSVDSGAGNAGAACVPLMGTDRCVGAIYVDGGLKAMSFSPSQVDRLVQLGETAGRLLQTAASLKVAFGEKRSEGIRDVSKAASDAVGRLLERLNGPDGVSEALQHAADRRNKGDLETIRTDLEACVTTLENLHANFLTLGQSVQHEPLPMDVNLVIAEVVARLDSFAAANGVRLRFERGNRALVYADDRDLACVLTNVLRNAIQASDRGDSVTVTAENKIEGCTITVEDTGAGMSEEVASAIAANRDLLPHGFGLAAAKAALDRTNGAWRVQPGPDGGTSVTLVLPQRES